eukprot:766600-Hanusia_phi.AAC.3
MSASLIARMDDDQSSEYLAKLRGSFRCRRLRERRHDEGIGRTCKGMGGERERGERRRLRGGGSPTRANPSSSFLLA